MFESELQHQKMRCAVQVRDNSMSMTRHDKVCWDLSGLNKDSDDSYS